MKDIDYLKKYLKNKPMEKAIEELNSGIPVQYIVGDTNFYGFDIKVDKRALIPRFETELLVSKTIDYMKDIKNPKVLEIGTGTACISIALSNILGTCVTAGDISEEALSLAKENVLSNKADVNLVLSDVFNKIDGKFDLIISNPPYIDYNEEVEEKVLVNEPHLALFAENGIFFYEKILSEANQYISDKALIAFEIGHEQGGTIEKIAKKNFPNSMVKIEKDYQERDRFLFVFIGLWG